MTKQEIIELAKTNAVYRNNWRSKHSWMDKSSISKYMRIESPEPQISHVNEGPHGETCYWLKSYGMDSWMIEVPA